MATELFIARTTSLLEPGVCQLSYTHIHTTRPLTGGPFFKRPSYARNETPPLNYCRRHIDLAIFLRVILIASGAYFRGWTHEFSACGFFQLLFVRSLKTDCDSLSTLFSTRRVC
jgi:hypothetical protein